jgi:hypothetical protein
MNNFVMVHRRLELIATTTHTLVDTKKDNQTLKKRGFSLLLFSGWPVLREGRAHSKVEVIQNRTSPLESSWTAQIAPPYFDAKLWVNAHEMMETETF